jgi:predicted phosphoribosyltransferase
MIFRDRRDAGRQLAQRLSGHAGNDVVVLALPRGGVPVGYEVARALGAPLDVFVVRKLGVPGRSELAMGAIASGGVRVVNREVVDGLAIPAHVIDHVAVEEEAELARREAAYRGFRLPADVRGRSVVLVDDGLATGSSMRAAAHALRKRGPRRIVVAVPVASPSTCEELRQDVDAIVCVETPATFQAVGQFYEDFSQTGDEEVRELLQQAWGLEPAGRASRGAGERS